MKDTIKKVWSLLLVVCMVVGMLPATVLAAYDYAHNEAESSDDYYKLINKTDWDIAPGIKETEIVLNNSTGDRRQVVHLMEADMSNPYTRVISSYTNMDTSNYAISTIPEHAAYLEKEWGENVVGAMNTCLSWYNSAAYQADPSRVNEPLGFMMVDGDVYFDHSVGFPTCIVIHKDYNDAGEERPSDIPKVEMRTVTDSTCLNGWEDQVIPSSSGYIVKDGVNQYKSNHGTDTAARSVVGVKADGSIVIMMNDGRQSPYSLGMTMYECAEVMIAAGCIYAANCDGGGSSTFMSQRPGEDLTVNCSPCDGSLRQNTHGIMIISTAPSTGEFNSAFLKTDNDYYVPYSTVAVEAIGLDFSGAEAEIPAEATWTLADNTMGSISNGVFVSNGKVGDVEIQLNYNGAVVGSKIIHIVNPDTVAFSQSSTVIPYGKSVVLGIEAMYGEFEVSYTSADFDWVVSDTDAGALNGMTFSATNNTAKTGVSVSATYKYANLGTTTINISFGKGSEILYSFEDGNISNWLGIEDAINWAKTNSPNSPLLDASPLSGQFTPENSSKTFLATAQNGKVKNGNYALGVELDYTNSGGFGQWSYNMFFNVEGQTVLRDTANGMNATRLGMWIYIPEELAPGHNLAMQTELYCGSSSTNYARKNTHLILECNGKTLTSCSEADIPEDRWVYCYMDLTPYNYVSLQNPYTATSTRREPQFIRFYTQSKEPFKAVFYFDDITLDYSDAVDDRNAPEISDIIISTSGTTIRSFSARIADYAASNASGLNYASGKIYVDGIALSGVTTSGSTLGSSDVSLLPGTHTVTFEIADNMGNVMKKSQIFTIEGTTSISVSGHNDLNNVPQYDSVYYVDINAANVETVTSLTTSINLNFANTWELEHMIVAEGFEAEYTLSEHDNVATITVTKTGDTATGAATLLSIPVRVWSWDAEAAGYESSEIGANSYPLVYIKIDVRKASVLFADGTNGTFDGALTIDTALLASVVPTDWHSHNAVAVADLAATCATDGYVGRTYCNDCGSVVDWGTTMPTKEHSYYVNADGKIACLNGGELFNGVYIDGKTYVDGVVMADGWGDESYYKDGVKVTGMNLIDGKYYLFDENGICANNYPHSGWYTYDNGDTYYMNAGIPETYYCYINPNPAFFDANGVAWQGEKVISGETCVFEKGIFVESTTADVKLAGLAGDNVYFVLYEDGTLVLSGEGATYDYIHTANQTSPLYAWKNRPWGNQDHENSKSIKKVIVGKDITYIGSYSFNGCHNIKEVLFEKDSKLKTIKDHAFHYAYQLRSLTLPDSVITMEFSAFGYCGNLSYVKMSEELTNINNNAFWNNRSDLLLNVVKGSKSEKFAINNGIAYETRESAYAPADIRPGEEVLVSGSCGANATWTLYESGRMVISGSGAVDSYSSFTKTPWYSYKNQVKTLKIGKDITEIGSNAFSSLLNVEHIVFEEGSKLHTLNNHAFHYAANVTRIELPETVKFIGYSAFGYCSKLEYVYMPEMIKTSEISFGAFVNANENAVLHVVENSGAYTYVNKNNMQFELRESIYSPEDVKPDDVILASGNCGNEVTWTLYESGKMVIEGKGAVDSYTSFTKTPWYEYKNQITSLKIGKDITEIGNYAFASLLNVESIVFEEGSKLHTLKNHAFHYAAKITSITLPESLKSLGFSALGYCEKLVDVYVPESLTNIYVNAFWNHNENMVLKVTEGTKSHRYAVENNIKCETHTSMYGPTDVIPGEQVVASGDCGFDATWTLYESGKMIIEGTGAVDSYSSFTKTPWYEYKNQVKALKIGKDITEIGSYAFASLLNAEYIVFEEGSKIHTINDHAFHYASNITSIKLPETVKTLGYSALGYCANLVEVEMPTGQISINKMAFWNDGENLILVVAENSDAHKFAINNNIKYVIN